MRHASRLPPRPLSAPEVEFSWVRAEQALALFEAVLAPLLAAPSLLEDRRRLEAELRRLPRLAPGDFAAVARRVRLLGWKPTAADLVRELEQEVLAKEGERRAVRF